MAEDPYRYFRSEARDIVERLGEGVLRLEKEVPAPDLVPALFRLAHTLKGAARVVKQGEIADMAHAIEDLLAPLREKGESLTRASIEEILKHLDAIGSRVALLSPPQARESGERPALPPAEARTIRAEVTELDDLLDGLAEVSAQVGTMRQALRTVERARHLAELLSEHAASPRLREARSQNGAASRVETLCDELRTTLASLERDGTVATDNLSRELRQTRASAERLRLVPAGALFSSLQRTARDAAEHQGKQVDFASSGGDVRLDAHVLAVLLPALVQLVRNAVVHGIENPANRKAAGKPAAGRVVVEVAKRGRRIAFSCEDDGRGVDVAAVRSAALQRGLLPASESSLAADAVLELLLKGGLTTAGAVSQVSGRGVGLDVVRDATMRLGGTVSVRTRPNRGTTIEILVPASLSSVDALLLDAAGVTVAIPLASVRRSIRLRPDQISRSSHGLSIVHEGRSVPFAPVSSLLSITERLGSHHAWSAVVVESGTSRAAVGATRLLAAETLVVRPLPPATPAISLVLGASIDSDGTPQLILDPDEIVPAIERGTVRASETPQRHAPILIIDDSPTTRMLEQSILESAGYDTHLASSAEQALAMARRTHYALFLVDVEMPGMDGFEFLDRVREHHALRDVPAILVTSRNAASDRRRGEEAGARAYIVKSEFDQAELLRIIRDVIR